MITPDQIYMVNPDKLHTDISYEISTKIYILKFLCFIKLFENLYIVLIEQVSYNFIFFIISIIGLKTLKTLDHRYIIPYIIAESCVLVFKIACLLGIIPIYYKYVVICIDIFLQLVTCYVSIRFCMDVK